MTTQIEIEDFYPESYRPQRRYGDGRPPHSLIESILEKRLDQYHVVLRELVSFAPDFLRISRDFDKSKPYAPYWLNGFVPALDAIALYGLIATRKPRVFFEIGSGHSTKFAVAAKRAHSQRTQIISVDPAPRAGIDQICDQVIRQPLQDCDLAMIQDLRPNDILFLDGTHRVLQNSDVSVFFLEVLPMLRPGVLVHVHDVYWPLDYPIEWARRMYSEQFILGALLLFAEDKLDILLPNAYISYHPEWLRIFSDIWNAPHLEGLEQYGVGFWFSKK